MRLAGFHFTKIAIEKKSNELEKAQIDTNIKILNIEDLKSEAVKKNEQLLDVSFDYTINYKEDIAKVEFKGNLLVIVDSKKGKEILEQWKSKKLPEDVQMSLINVIIKKSNVKALNLEEEVKLPYHLPLPGVKKEQQKPKKQ
ncbi:MAG: hypothetical protein ACOCUU_00515 [Nanoarchaeota archaeon]